MKKTLLFLFVSFCMTHSVIADVITLNNGDRISGVIREIDAETLEVTSEVFGVMNISKEKISSIMNEEVVKVMQDEIVEKKKIVEEIPELKEQAIAVQKYWNHKLSAGYSMTNGNTKTSAANISLNSHYKRDQNDWNIKSSLDYASSNGRMTTQKFYSKAQSDYRFVDSKWFNTRSVEVSHDKFAHVDYRILPAIGMGYWFWEGDDSKAEFDTAVGYEYTNYNTTDTKATGNFALIPHLYFDKVIIGKSKFSQDLTMYPSLESFADYRLRSESAFVNPLSDTLSFKISYIMDYNSTPKNDAKKSDTTLMSSIEYAF